MPKKTAPDSRKGDRIDAGRRKFLIGASSVVGAVGVAGTAYPFVKSLFPSRKAVAAAQPIEIDISKIDPGQQIQVEWQHKPVWVLRRTQTQVASLGERVSRLKDPKSNDAQQLPQYANKTRSIKPDISVLIGICTHLGCIPDYKPKPGSINDNWIGGYHCPCHGSLYDLAGRVFDGSPAPMNLPVPPYYFLTDQKIKVGELKDGSHSNWSPAIW